MHVAGGLLGWLTRGRMPKEFDEAAFALKPGELSSVIETRMGYEIIFVAERKEERERAFEEVRDNIKNSLFARKRKSVAMFLRNSSRPRRLSKSSSLKSLRHSQSRRIRPSLAHLSLAHLESQ